MAAEGGVAAAAFGALLGLVAVFAAFHAQGDEVRIPVVAAPVVVVVNERPDGSVLAAAGSRDGGLAAALAALRGRVTVGLPG